MTGLGHKITGLCAAVFSIAIMPEMSILSSAMLAIACIFGATAPDWLEIAWHSNEGRRRSIIPHRKVTHWIPLWLGLLLYAIYYLDNAHSYILIGFAVGGLTHLLVDIPNPMGVPLFHPWRNVSLNWWKSGERERLIILTFILVDVFFISGFDEKLIKGFLL